MYILGCDIAIERSEYVKLYVSKTNNIGMFTILVHEYIWFHTAFITTSLMCTAFRLLSVILCFFLSFPSAQGMYAVGCSARAPRAALCSFRLIIILFDVIFVSRYHKNK